MTGCWMAAPKSSSLGEGPDRSFTCTTLGLNPGPFFWGLRVPEWAIPVSSHQSPLGETGTVKIMARWGYNSQIVFKVLLCSSDQNNGTLRYLPPQESYLNLMMGLNSFELQRHFIRKDQKYCKENFNNLSYFQIKFVKPQQNFKKTSQSL